jgi:serine phosphatase RsbU (regulator of sigma subunit)
VFGSVLGATESPQFEDSEVTLAPGDVMLLYTDGVTEAGPRGAPLGEAGLTSLLSELAGSEARAVVDAVEQAVVGAQEGDPRDDIALLAIRHTPNLHKAS